MLKVLIADTTKMAARTLVRASEGTGRSKDAAQTRKMRFGAEVLNFKKGK